MDIDMPGKNGIEIIRELFQDNHNDKILVCFLSSYSQKPTFDLNLDDYIYIPKPIDQQKLFLILEKYHSML